MVTATVVISAYERLNRSSVPIAVPESSIGVTREQLWRECRDFWGFCWVSPVSQFHPSNSLYFSISPLYTHINKVLHHIGSESSWTFTYELNWDRQKKQHFSTAYYSWKQKIASCTIIQLDFFNLCARLLHKPVPLIPSSMSSCIDACPYSKWHTVH